MRDDNARRFGGRRSCRGSYPARTAIHPQAVVVVVVRRADANMSEQA